MLVVTRIFIILPLVIRSTDSMSFQRRLFRFRRPISKFHTTDASSSADKFMIGATKTWVKTFVHAHGMCPFAGSVLADNSLRINIIKSDDTEITKIMTDLFNKTMLEAKILCESTEVRTTLLVVPQMDDFSDYLALIHNIEEYVVDIGLDEHIQVATFHPNYQFEGTNADDVSNWSNRSPFPVIHLLREDDVSEALKKYPYDPNDIWKKNIEKLNTLGRDNIEKLMAKIIEEAKEL